MIYEGKMAYFEPANLSRQYFIDPRYEPAYRQMTCDFVISVTDPKTRFPGRGVLSAPRSAQEFFEYFKKSRLAAANCAQIQAFRSSFSDERTTSFKDSVQAEYTSRGSSSYTISRFPDKLLACFCWVMTGPQSTLVIWGEHAATLVAYLERSRAQLFKLNENPFIFFFPSSSPSDLAYSAE